MSISELDGSMPRSIRESSLPLSTLDLICADLNIATLKHSAVLPPMPKFA
jgi:hypothetical protein